MKRTGVLSIGMLIGMSLAIFPVAASAALVYDNGSPVFIGQNITQVRAADDFVLGAPATITAVRFFGSAFTGNTFPANFSGDIAWAIYNDSSGSIGSVISSGAVSSLTPTLIGPLPGFSSADYYQIDFDLNSSVALGAGTYWLELHEGATLSSNDGTAITWTGFGTSGNAVSGSLTGVPTTDSNVERAFQLFDNTEAIPEPGTNLLMAGPLAALFFWLRRRGLRGPSAPKS